jgi:hypothetical protein
MFAPDAAARISDAIYGLNTLFGLTPQINSGYRTAADQYYQAHGGSGGNPASQGVSDHQLGYAVDIQPGANLMTTSSEFNTVKLYMQSIGFHWQGSSDRPHFFLDSPYRTQADKAAQAGLLERYYKQCVNPLAR